MREITPLAGIVVRDAVHTEVILLMRRANVFQTVAMHRWLVLVPCLVLIDAPLSGCTTKTCTARGCLSGAMISLDEVAVADVAGGQLQVCRNQVCDVFEIQSDGSHTVIAQPLGARVNVLQAAERETFQIEIPPGDDVSYPYDLVNGDLYSVEVRSASDVVVAGYAWDAMYEEMYPNGPDCDEVPCRAAFLDRTNAR